MLRQQTQFLKVILVLLFIIILPILPSSQTINFEIEGKLDKPFNGHLYLFYNSTVDSTLVDGLEYTFKGTINGPTEASLRTQNGFSSGLLYLDKGITKIVSAIDSLEDGNIITSVDLVSGNETHDVVLPKMLHALDHNRMESLLEEGRSEEILKVTRVLFEEFSNHPLSGELLAELAYMDFMEVDDIESLFGLLNKDKLSPETSHSIHKIIEKKKIYTIGSPMFDFSFTDKDNKPHYINDFRGKYLLIEFWGAGCGPCRAEHPSLIATREQYNANFEILGVSLDGNNSGWQLAVSEDQLTWINTRVKGDADKAVIEKLGIDAIPANFLLDPDGIILAVNITARQLRAHLDAVLKTD